MNEESSVEKYSHWSCTGLTPKPHEGMSPLDSAIAFERYRLMVISRWPEDENKQDEVRMIQGVLDHLESDLNFQRALDRSVLPHR
jgi:hypothetical protein